MMKRKNNDPNKLLMITAGTFVGVMLVLSIALYFLGGTTAQAEAQNFDTNANSDYKLEALDAEQEVEVNLPIGMTSPSDELTLDMAGLDSMGDLEAQQVPEPSMLALLGVGGLALMRRRRRKA